MKNTTITGKNINFMIDALAQELGANNLIDDLAAKLDPLNLYTVLQEIAEENTLWEEIQEGLLD